MGKIIFILVVLGIAYAWHQGMLDQYLNDPATGRYNPSDRYGEDRQTPQQRCAAARARLEEQENLARGRSGVIDRKVQNPALEDARHAVREQCPH